MPKNLDTFTNFLILQKGLRKSTVKGHVNNISKLLSEVEFFKQDQVMAYVADMQKDYAPNYIRSVISGIRKYCDFLIYQGELKHNFGYDLKLPSMQRSKNISLPTDDEVEAIIKAKVRYTDFGLAKTWQLIHRLLAKTGMRNNELRSLKVKDLHFDTNVIEVKATVNKTKKTKIIPMPAPIIQDLKNYVKNKNENDLVFKSARDNPISSWAIADDLRKRLEKTGIKKKLSGHDYRRYFITTMHKNGCPLIVIADIVGHSDIKTTQGYTHLMVDELAKAMTKYHPLISKRMSRRERLIQVKESIEETGIFKDRRFKTNLNQTNNSLELKIEF